LLAAPFVEAQQATRMRRVSFVLSHSPLAEMAGPEPVHPIFRAFVHELRSLGYVEGRNLVLERRTAEGRLERYVGIFTELARLDTEVIVALGGYDPFKRACDAVSKIPVVMFGGSEPVKYGLARSLAHPGGNVTGLTYYTSPEVEAKRFQLLKDAVPTIARASYLVPQGYLDDVIVVAARHAAQTMRIELLFAEYAGHDFAEAFATIEKQKPDALFASPFPAIFAYRQQVIGLARKARLPDSYAHPEMAAAGGFMSYGIDSPDLGRRAAHYVDKILKGARAGDLAIELPTKFDFVVNLRTARELGVTIPRPVLLGADRVIE
jgi:putative ABC transport system substrate-binding protein